MRILLIDNDTVLLKELKNIIPGHTFVHKWNDLGNLNSKDFDAVILSGGSAFQIVGNEEKLKDEIRIIKDCAKPLIGICYGNELIVETFGGTLEKMDVKHSGVSTVNVVVSDKIFGNLKTFEVFESHEWRIEKMPRNFTILAKSSHSIEAIKHKSLPIYGFQFHPEKSIVNGYGGVIFMNLLKLV